ncbi:MAG TPA: hypothetical protein VME46_07090 [Acidimicrobiales bacterium]|nr:hypothetical protein [Acidimicrobiales bacterium]
MPATSIGDATRYSTAVAWAASQVKSLGDLVTPSTPNGQVWIVTTAGTTAASEPSWNTPPYPTLGTTFTDGGGVGFTCYGTQPGPFPTIAQFPVDTDPPLAYPQIITGQTVLDQLAWITANAALLSTDNTWTGTNLFENEVAFTGASGDTNPATVYGAVPSTRKLEMEILLGFVSGHEIISRLYGDHSIASDLSDELGVGLSLTVNAAWNGTQWAPDLLNYDSIRFVFGGSTFSVFEAKESGNFNDSIWGSPLLYLQTDSGSREFALAVPTVIDSTFEATGAATLESTLAVTGAATLASTLAVTGAVTMASTLGVSSTANLGALVVTGSAALDNTLYVGDDVSLSGVIAEIGGATTAPGAYGVNATLGYTTASSVSGGTTTTLTISAPVTGFYRLEAYVEITTGSDTPVAHAAWVSADSQSNSTGTVNMTQVNTGTSHSSRDTFVYSIVVWAKSGNNLTIEVATVSSDYNAALSITGIA